MDRTPGAELPEGVELSGWTLILTDEKPDLIKTVEKMRKSGRYYDSIGLSVSNESKVGAIVPGSPVDDAGLINGTEILGVNGRRFSSDRFEDAVRESEDGGPIDLLLDVQGRLVCYSIPYDGGLLYYALERNEDRPDELSRIFTPRTWTPQD